MCILTRDQLFCAAKVFSQKCGRTNTTLLILVINTNDTKLQTQRSALSASHLYPLFAPTSMQVSRFVYELCKVRPIRPKLQLRNERGISAENESGLIQVAWTRKQYHRKQCTRLTDGRICARKTVLLTAAHYHERTKQVQKSRFIYLCRRFKSPTMAIHLMPCRHTRNSTSKTLDV